ncbi:MT-A70 family methyltransferase [Pseudoalteromonas sp. SW0106-04]|uniref:MT-A70 family methyltransferase n=1 Tax=Pseudoalteromonas sp. SW0106-04 TaxID=1702169 RepID=UPI0006B5ACC3|nr:MT-A70 family methyltransferase [Pseudoalteromonas sp. SW0106-04]
MLDKTEGKKYQLIYADPPWKFRNVKTGGSFTSGATQHYKGVLDMRELKQLPVDQVADDNCILVMWWVSSMPQEALDVVSAWGFTLKNMNGFVWNKLTKNHLPHFGMGFWTRAGSESALIAIKGKPKVASRSVRAVGSYPIREHSRKPDEFRDKCVMLAGDIPRIELFARTTATHWDAWGNETAKFNKQETT